MNPADVTRQFFQRVLITPSQTEESPGSLSPLMTSKSSEIIANTYTFGSPSRPQRKCSDGPEMPFAKEGTKTEQVTQGSFESPPRLLGKRHFDSPEVDCKKQVNQAAPESPRRSSFREESEDLFSFLRPEESGFLEDDFSEQKTPYLTPATPAPQYRRLSKHKHALTGAALSNQERFEAAREIWDKIVVNYKFIGEGNFHCVYELDETTVIKIPNNLEIRKSQKIGCSTPLCFMRGKNAKANYLALQKAREDGIIPDFLHLAATEFHEKDGTIRQEKWDRPFSLEDMDKPEVVNTVKAILQLLAEGGCPDMDFRPPNLGWKNGKLKLFDFLEETHNKSKYSVKKFAAEFAKKNKEVLNYIMPLLK